MSGAAGAGESDTVDEGEGCAGERDLLGGDLLWAEFLVYFVFVSVRVVGLGLGLGFSGTMWTKVLLDVQSRMMMMTMVMLRVTR